MGYREELIKKQNYFAYALGELLEFAKYRGYLLTFPKEHINHMEGSLHFEGLAKDINLYTKDFVYLTDTEDYRELGEFWELLGGAWGGRFNDGCHFSFEHNGKK